MPKVAKNEQRVEPQIPISAVPHLYNAQMLRWQETQFNALKSIYEKLDEILIALKENRHGVPSSTN